MSPTSPLKLSCMVGMFGGAIHGPPSTRTLIWCMPGRHRDRQLPEVAAVANERERTPVAEVAHHVDGLDAADADDDALHAAASPAWYSKLRTSGECGSDTGTEFLASGQ